MIRRLCVDECVGATGNLSPPMSNKAKKTSSRLTVLFVNSNKLAPGLYGDRLPSTVECLDHCSARSQAHAALADQGHHDRQGSGVKASAIVHSVAGGHAGNSRRSPAAKPRGSHPLSRYVR